MDDNGVEIEFVEVHHKVKVDLTKLTWGDALSLQKAQTDPAMTDDEREHMTTAMVSKITGEAASSLPAVVVAARVCTSGPLPAFSWSIFDPGAAGRSNSRTSAGSMISPTRRPSA